MKILVLNCGSSSVKYAGSSRPCSGSEHMFSHALDMTLSDHSMHGEQCGVGTIMMAYLHRTNWKRIKETLKKLGAPTNVNDLGIQKEDVTRALEMASSVRPERYTILNRQNLNQEACQKIAEATEVI